MTSCLWFMFVHLVYNCWKKKKKVTFLSNSGKIQVVSRVSGPTTSSGEKTQKATERSVASSLNNRDIQFTNTAWDSSDCKHPPCRDVFEQDTETSRTPANRLGFGWSKQQLELQPELMKSNHKQRHNRLNSLLEIQWMDWLSQVRVTADSCLSRDCSQRLLPFHGWILSRRWKTCGNPILYGISILRNCIPLKYDREP